ncbi:hypothetical protein ABIF13_004892 [Bradyrhizobium elkanii]
MSRRLLSGWRLDAGRVRQRRAAGLAGQRMLCAALLLRAGLLRALPARRARLLAGTVLLTRLLRGVAVLARQAVLPLRVRLHRLAAVRIGRGRIRPAEVGIGAAEVALLGHDLTAQCLRAMDLAHKALVARDLLRRDRQRHRCEAGAAGARTNRKAARAARQHAERSATAVVDLDAADMSVGVGIELDADIPAGRGGAFGHFDEAGGAADAERRGRGRDLHVAGLGDRGGDEGRRSLGDVEQRAVLLAAVLIEIIVDRDPGIGAQVEGGAVVEGDAERGGRRCRDLVIGKDVVADLQRRRGVFARDGRGSCQCCHVADRLRRRGLRIRGRRRRCRSGRSRSRCCRRRTRRRGGRLCRLRLCEPRQVRRGIGRWLPTDRDAGAKQQREEKGAAHHHRFPGRQWGRQLSRVRLNAG